MTEYTHTEIELRQSVTFEAGEIVEVQHPIRLPGFKGAINLTMPSHDFQGELRWLGASSSPAFGRAPEGNGCAERFIRTLKENLLCVRTFATVEELCLALLEFRDCYNEHWLIERHSHRSPAQFRRDQMDSEPVAA